MSDKTVKALKPRPKRYAVADPELVGHYIRIQPTGAKSFVAVALDPFGRQVWATLGSAGVLGIGAAREKARAAIKRVKAGEAPFEEPTPRAAIFGDVATQWLKRHVSAKGLRTAPDIARLLERHVLPVWKRKAFAGIRRADVSALLDDIEDRSGARQADQTLAILRSMGNWWAARRDDYTPPFVRGMRRASTKERASTRILADDELRAVWKAAEAGGKFGARPQEVSVRPMRRTFRAGSNFVMRASRRHGLSHAN